MESFANFLFSAIHVGFMALLVALLFRPDLRSAFERRCVGFADANDLAYVRIVICCILIIYVMREDLAGHARLGREFFSAHGVMRLAGQDLFDWFHTSRFRLRALTWSVVVALFFSCIGLFTRVSKVVAAALYLLFAALLRSHGKAFHEGYLSWYVLLVLCFLPSGDAWSLDARLKARREPSDTAYGWSVYACYAAACVPYLQLSLSKLSSAGLEWFDGDGLRNLMLADDLNLTEWNFDLGLRFYRAPSYLFSIGGAFAVLTEFLYPMTLFIPRLRRYVPAGVSLLHVNIWLWQDLLFTDAVLAPLIFYVPSTWKR